MCLLCFNFAREIFHVYNSSVTDSYLNNSTTPFFAELLPYECNSVICSFPENLFEKREERLVMQSVKQTERKC